MSAMPTASRPVPDTLLKLKGFYRLSVDQYHAMIRAGVFVESEPVELLEGYLVDSPRPLSPRAAVARTRVHKALFRVEPAGWAFFPLGALTLSDSEPEPDFSIVRSNADSYRIRFPGPGEIGLVGEVSESSLAFDRSEKGRMYARAGIAVYWVVNVIDRQVEVYTDPDTTAEVPAYRTRTDYRPGQDVPVVLDSVAAATIPVSELVP